MKNSLAVAIQASLEAGDSILEVYSSNDFNVEIKGDESPLTRADKNANDVINRFLSKTNFPIISEENRQLDYADRKDWSACWIVDPLDGTKEFIKRNGEFTVNIALIKNGNPVLGVIYVPVSKTLYFTSEDASKSFKFIVNERTLSVDQIIALASEITPSDKNPSIVKIVGSRSHLNEDTKKFISEIENKKQVEIVSKGSSLKFCLVAEGESAYISKICTNNGVGYSSRTSHMSGSWNKSY